MGKFWWARELSGFRRWLAGEAESQRLRLVGIDDQISATSVFTRSFLPARIAERNGHARMATCFATVSRHLSWSYDELHPFDAAEQQELLDCARDAAGPAGDAAGAPHASDAETGAALDAAMANNFASYIARQLKPTASGSRDDVLAANLLWHLARGPADAKVIVWTATVHGARRPGRDGIPPMGATLAASFGDSYGVVAFTAYSGASSMAGRAPITFETAPANSLEARAIEQGAVYRFLDHQQLAHFGAVESRLLGKFANADWSTHFDAVIVVREETPAQFEALE